jgi:glutaminyl-peptide cyclotransferase
VCCVAALCALALGGVGCGGSDHLHRAPHGLRVDRFDSARAWALVRQQVAVGPRPAGSPQLRGLAEELRRVLPAGRFETVPGEPGLRNVVGTLPGRRPGIVVGAHYDTLVKPRGFVGANNGAAGTAVVIEAARALAEAEPNVVSREDDAAGAPREDDAAGAPGEDDSADAPGDGGASDAPREVRFVLFDGEEPAAGLPEESADFYHSGLRGSRAYVDAHRGRTGAMVLLDYVAGRRLRLPREASSSLELWSRLRASARAVGAGHYFPTYSAEVIVDDHTPFLRAGVPAVDLIDWRYPGHDLRDGLDRLSRRSIDAVGETVVELVLRLRASRPLGPS